MLGGFRTRKKSKVNIPLTIFIAVICCWAGYFLAGCIEPGTDPIAWTMVLNEHMKRPMANYWNKYSVPGIFVGLFVFLIIFLMYLSSMRNYIPGEEMGSAKFLDPKILSQKLSDPKNDPSDNKVIVMYFKKAFPIKRIIFSCIISILLVFLLFVKLKGLLV